MKRIKTLLRAIGLLGLTLVLAQPASAVIVDIIYVGTWDSVASGNPTGVGGPGLSVGQKYVIRISWDDASTTTDGVAVLDAFFSPSGNTMRTIDLTDSGNSLDIFVPMEGLDTGSPFIYTQNEADHFPFPPPSPQTPTLNFMDGSDISNTANIIGLEFEGNFATGANFNIIELFNTSPPQAGTPDPTDINMVSQVVNCGDINCISFPGPAANDTNGLVVASDLIVDAGPGIVYDATMLTKTTASAVLQSNDLGAGRSDGEDFIDAAWLQTGTATGNDIEVAIANSGLTMTTDTTTWNVLMTEQMTGKSASDTVLISYMNALPTASASATGTGTGTDFNLTFDDADLIVNFLIGGFEALTVTALIDGLIDGTTFFASLISGGIQSSTDAMLAAAFGVGAHAVDFTVFDKAGAFAIASVVFDAGDIPIPVPEPESFALLMLGLLTLIIARRRPLFTAR